MVERPGRPRSLSTALESAKERYAQTSVRGRPVSDACLGAGCRERTGRQRAGRTGRYHLRRDLRGAAFRADHHVLCLDVVGQQEKEARLAAPGELLPIETPPRRGFLLPGR